MIAPPPESVPTSALVNVAPASTAGADVLLRAAMAVAEDRNTRVHGPAPCPVELYVYDADDTAAARAETPGCRVYFDRAWRNMEWGIYTDRTYALADRRDAVAEVCAVATHEELHNRGFQHAPTGIMAPVLSVIPGACRAFARRLLPRR